jgi:hypothetical protein
MSLRKLRKLKLKKTRTLLKKTNIKTLLRCRGIKCPLLGIPKCSRTNLRFIKLITFPTISRAILASHREISTRFVGLNLNLWATWGSYRKSSWTTAPLKLGFLIPRPRLTPWMKFKKRRTLKPTRMSCSRLWTRRLKRTNCDKLNFKSKKKFWRSIRCKGRRMLKTMIKLSLTSIMRSTNLIRLMTGTQLSL